MSNNGPSCGQWSYAFGASLIAERSCCAILRGLLRLIMLRAGTANEAVFNDGYLQPLCRDPVAGAVDIVIVVFINVLNRYAFSSIVSFAFEFVRVWYRMVFDINGIRADDQNVRHQASLRML